eukprot:1160473-Pelagomonas_calceolata.AAC.10
MVITADTHTPLELEEIWDSHEEPSATSMLPTIVVYVLAHQCFPLALYIKCHANASRERCTCKKKKNANFRSQAAVRAKKGYLVVDVQGDHKSQPGAPA